MTTRGRGLHGHVLESLGPAITAGDPPGSVLRTDELAQRFEVSRSVMREAVRVLESMYLVESRRRVGVTVRPKAEWNVFDPQVIRWRLAGAEPASPAAFAHRAALHHGTDHRGPVRPARRPPRSARNSPSPSAWSSATRGHKLEEYLVHDMAFHRVILNTSGNEMFAVSVTWSPRSSRGAPATR